MQKSTKQQVALKVTQFFIKTVTYSYLNDGRLKLKTDCHDISSTKHYPAATEMKARH